MRTHTLVKIQMNANLKPCYLAIGSNIGNLDSNLNNAIEEIKKIPKSEFIKASSFLRNAAYGITDQPEFLNAVVEIKTELEPKELLTEIKAIEKNLGRKKTYRWGPRLIDIDIILYDDIVYSDEVLDIPHKDMENRDFVLIPLAEIAPKAVHPVLGISIADLEHRLRNR